MTDLLKRGVAETATKTAVVTAVVASPPAAVGADALAASVAAVAVLAAVGIGTFKATLFGLETLEKLFTRK